MNTVIKRTKKKWQLDVLGIPYGGPINGRDSDGEFFDAQTKLHDDKFPLPPAVYYHGMDENGNPSGSPEYIGKTVSFEDKPDGRWYQVVLDKGNELARRVWDAAKQGIARASSGSIAHLARIANDGHILEWPVAELSLFDAVDNRQPANAYAVALPVLKTRTDLKALIQKADGTPATDDATATVTDEEEVLEQNEVIKMEEQNEEKVPAVDLSPLLGKFDELGETMKAFNTRLDELDKKVDEPGNDPGPAAVKNVRVVKDETDKEVEAHPHKFGLMLQAVKAVALDPSAMTKAHKAILGQNESVPQDGGFLVGTEQDGGLDKKSFDEAVFASRAVNRTIASGANSIDFYGRKENSRVAGSRYGGIQGYRLAEGQEITASSMDFYKYTLKPEGYAVLAYATNQVARNAALLEAEISEAAAGELAFMRDNDMLNGSAAGYPEGILNANCLVSVAKETGQAAATVNAQNVIKMWARMWARSRANAAWFINQDVEPQLMQLNLSVGTGGQLIYMPPGGLSASPYGSLFGRPVIPTEFNATLGTVGDIVLADWSQYKLANMGAIQAASSMHVQFITNQMAWRFIFEYDGQATWEAALTPFKGSNTQSPFIALATRS